MKILAHATVAMLVAQTLIACGEASPTAPRAGQPPAVAAPLRSSGAEDFASLESPAQLTNVLGVTSIYDAGMSQPLGVFPTPTVVDLVAEGVVTITWDPRTGRSGGGGLDPGGRRAGYYGNICTGYGEIGVLAFSPSGQWLGNQWLACENGLGDAQGDRYPARLSLYGTTTVYRSIDSSPGWIPGVCGGFAWDWPCFNYSGSTTVTVTRLDAQLTLAADSTSVAPGNRVTATAGTDPGTFQDLHGHPLGVPLYPQRWSFRPDGDGEQAAADSVLTSCGTARSCTFAPPRSGTILLDAVVNGHVTTQNVHVTVRGGRVVIEPADGRTPVRMRPSEIVGIRSNPLVSTKTLRVRVVDAAGHPIPNADVALTAKGQDGSGGHEHFGNRPNGGFGTSGGASLTVNTGPTGETTVSYRAPDPSGVVTIRGTSGDYEPGTLDIAVVVEGLVLVSETSGVLVYVGEPGDHHSRFWTTSTERDKLVALADTLVKRFAKETLPSGMTRELALNDASLPTGGQFDINGDWQPPHADHRRGQGADLRTRDKTEEQTDFMRAYWELHGGSVYDETAGQNPNATGPHYHFKECATCSR